MNPSLAAQAADILVDRRISGTQGDRLPADCRPLNLCDSLQIQDEVSRVWCERMDDSIGGWKASLPPQDRVILGPIYTRTIDSVAPVSIWPKGDLARIEPELAFYFGVDMPARAQPYSPEEVDAAVVRCHMALELIQGRFSDPSQCEFIENLADGLFNQGLFIGPQVNLKKAAAASDISFRISSGGETLQEHAGHHPNDKPMAPLYWLVEFLRARGQGIMAGQAVITGSYAGVLEVPLNKPLEIHYGELGTLAVTFTPKSNG